MQMRLTWVVFIGIVLLVGCSVKRTAPATSSKTEAATQAAPTADPDYASAVPFESLESFGSPAAIEDDAPPSEAPSTSDSSGPFSFVSQANGHLLRVDANGKQTLIAKGVSRFNPNTPDGSTLILRTNGELWKQPAAQASPSNLGTLVAKKVVDFNQYDSQGSILVKTGDHKLWLAPAGAAPSTSAFTLVAKNVSKFVADPSSNLVQVLKKDHTLYEVDLSQATPKATWVDGNVAAFSRNADGSYLVQGIDKRLWNESIGWKKTGRTGVTQNVAGFTGDAAKTGMIYVLDTNGKLWNQAANAKNAARKMIQTNVLSSMSLTDGSLYTLTRDKTLWHVSAEGSQKTKVASGVLAFDAQPDGSQLLIESTNRKLYLQPDASGKGKVLAASNVAAFAGAGGTNLAMAGGFAILHDPAGVQNAPNAGLGPQALGQIPSCQITLSTGATTAQVSPGTTVYSKIVGYNLPPGAYLAGTILLDGQALPDLFSGAWVPNYSSETFAINVPSSEYQFGAVVVNGHIETLCSDHVIVIPPAPPLPPGSAPGTGNTPVSNNPVSPGNASCSIVMSYYNYYAPSSSIVLGAATGYYFYYAVGGSGGSLVVTAVPDGQSPPGTFSGAWVPIAGGALAIGGPIYSNSTIYAEVLDGAGNVSAYCQGHIGVQ